MLYPDTETRSLLVREHQAELQRDVLLANRVRPEAAQSRGRRRRRLQLRWLQIRLRPANDLP
jgi:hypothetical protein